MKLTPAEVENRVSIGFCQPKFYKSHVWARAKRMMDNVVCPAGLAYPEDLGRGKGKYGSDLSIKEVAAQTVDILRKQGKIVEPTEAETA